MNSKKMTILSDLVSTLITVLPGISTIFIHYNLFRLLEHNYRAGLNLFSWLSLVFIPLTFILMIFIIRLCLPQMKAGSFKMDFNKGFLGWALNLALARSIRVFQVQELIYSSFVLKYLYWKAMGADIAFGINSSMYINLVDLPLIKIGKGSMLGDEVQVGCHLIMDNTIYLKEVTVGENSFIGINCKLGPGTKIGNNCKIGPWNFFMRHRIKDEQSVKPFEYFNKQ